MTLKHTPKYIKKVKQHQQNVNINLQTLDDRREDIPLLVANFLQLISKEADQERKVYAPEAVEMLVTAEWPGNIR